MLFWSTGWKDFRSTSTEISTLLGKVMQVSELFFIDSSCYLWVSMWEVTSLTFHILSVTGHYVPQLSQLVYEKNKGIQNPIINFKGFLVIIDIDLQLEEWCPGIINPLLFLLPYFRLGMLLQMIIMITLALSNTGGPMAWFLILPTIPSEPLVCMDLRSIPRWTALRPSMSR